MEGVRLALAQAIRLLRQAHVQLSDRRIVKAQQLIAAAAVLAGREAATRADLWPLLYVIPTAAGQLSARETLRELLAEASHPLLHAVVEQAAQQPMARLARLAESADLLLADAGGGDARLRIEALLREIDANFDVEQMPDQLGERRQRLIAAVGDR
jgi:MoxR-like ATPase